MDFQSGSGGAIRSSHGRSWCHGSPTRPQGSGVRFQVVLSGPNLHFILPPHAATRRPAEPETSRDLRRPAETPGAAEAPGTATGWVGDWDVQEMLVSQPRNVNLMKPDMTRLDSHQRPLYPSALQDLSPPRH